MRRSRHEKEEIGQSTDCEKLDVWSDLVHKCVMFDLYRVFSSMFKNISELLSSVIFNW